MTEQLLIFELPEFDRKDTRERVEHTLNLARLYMQVDMHPGIEPSVTPSYSLVPRSETNTVHSSTENVALKNVGADERAKRHVDMVIKALNCLHPIEERPLIVKRYLEDDYVTDADVCEALHLASRTYDRRKANALYKLALRLKVAKFKEGEKK